MQIDANTTTQFLRSSLIRQGLVCAAKVLPAGLSFSALADAESRFSDSACAELIVHHPLVVHHHLAGHDHLGDSQCWVYAQFKHNY